MHLLIILDFDGVLFNSAYEAYQVCEWVSKKNSDLRRGLHFEEFMEFRAKLTDAWQFNRLYNKKSALKDFSLLSTIEPDGDDWAFSKSFFSARAELMADENWAKLMSPYPFFYQVKPLINECPNLFKILSTRNESSIRRTLDFYGVTGLEIFGQEAIRNKGSKLQVALSEQWLQGDIYSIYIDDMNAHLEPFEDQVDLCLHAGWGYDTSGLESYTGTQAFGLLKGLLAINKGKK
jgi:hypothetical protein